MAICERCGAEFDLDDVRDEIDEEYWDGIYDSYYPDEMVCENCAIEQISADMNTGAEIADLMGSSWND